MHCALAACMNPDCLSSDVWTDGWLVFCSHCDSWYPTELDAQSASPPATNAERFEWRDIRWENESGSNTSPGSNRISGHDGTPEPTNGNFHKSNFNQFQEYYNLQVGPIKPLQQVGLLEPKEGVRGERRTNISRRIWSP